MAFIKLLINLPFTYLYIAALVVMIVLNIRLAKYPSTGRKKKLIAFEAVTCGICLMQIILDAAICMTLLPVFGGIIYAVMLIVTLCIR